MENRFARGQVILEWLIVASTILALMTLFVTALMEGEKAWTESEMRQISF